MSPPPENFTTWIAGLRKWHGWLQLSAERPYMHAEEEYNSYYGVAAIETREGEGFCNRPSTVWEKRDLSSELQSRLDKV